jgi:hypothetical protein
VPTRRNTSLWARPNLRSNRNRMRKISMRRKKPPKGGFSKKLKKLRTKAGKAMQNKIEVDVNK